MFARGRPSPHPRHQGLELTWPHIWLQWGPSPRRQEGRPEQRSAFPLSLGAGQHFREATRLPLALVQPSQGALRSSEGPARTVCLEGGGSRASPPLWRGPGVTHLPGALLDTSPQVGTGWDTGWPAQCCRALQLMNTDHTTCHSHPPPPTGPSRHVRGSGYAEPAACVHLLLVQKLGYMGI